MKSKITLLFCLLLCWQLTQAQTPIPIAQARTLSIGTTVTVAGIVTNGTELGLGLRYIQDTTAAIAAFSSSQLGSINRGDSILITGVLKDYNNLLELDPVSSVQVLATNRPMPAPVVFTGTITPAFAEQYEGQLVRLNGVTNLTTTAGAAVSTFSGNTNYNLNGSSSTQMRVNNASTGANGIVGMPAPSGIFDVIGIMGQFATGGPNTTSGYQLLPRLNTDIIAGAGPNIISGITPTAISTNSLTLGFTTQGGGNTVINYGPTSALGQSISDPALTTSHSATLSNLQPATVYYVQATSTDSNGTSTSAVIPVMTASLSSGNMKVYFNSPVDHTYAYPGNEATFLNHSIDDTLIAYINRAQLSIDATIYHWHMDSISNIGAALNAAHTRGVRVRVIMDALQNSTIFNNGHTVLDPAIQVLTRATSQGIMHNKFLIIDAESTNPNQPIVWTGSTNWTGTQINDDANSVIIIQDQSLAKAYVMEFEEIWNSTTATPGTPVWGSAKTSNTPQYFNIKGKRVELYFSPSDNVNTRLIQTINSADNDFFFASMLITRTDVGAAISNKFQQAGLNFCSAGLINDTSFTGGTAFLPVKNVMGSRLQLWNHPTIMHHKYLIVDTGDTLSDPVTWISTHNWSSSANNINDENTLVVHDPHIANQYYQEFVARMHDVDSSMIFCNFSVLSRNQEIPEIAATVYPNPNNGLFNIQLGKIPAANSTVSLFDLTGRLVKRILPQTATIEFNAQEFSKGIYYLQITTASVTTSHKVVIE